MDFLHGLRSFFGSFTRTTPESNTDAVVDPEEPLARFVFDKKHIDKKMMVKPDAFLPHGSPAETSVFRTHDLNEDEIWAIGATVAEKRQPSLKARADILVRALLGTPLRLVPDDNPPRHANIVGWPDEKSDQLLLAINLAADAKLRLVTQA